MTSTAATGIKSSEGALAGLRGHPCWSNLFFLSAAHMAESPESQGAVATWHAPSQSPTPTDACDLRPYVGRVREGRRRGRRPRATSLRIAHGRPQHVQCHSIDVYHSHASAPAPPLARHYERRERRTFCALLRRGWSRGGRPTAGGRCRPRLGRSTRSWLRGYGAGTHASEASGASRASSDIAQTPNA